MNHSTIAAKVDRSTYINHPYILEDEDDTLRYCKIIFDVVHWCFL